MHTIIKVFEVHSTAVAMIMIMDMDMDMDMQTATTLHTIVTTTIPVDGVATSGIRIVHTVTTTHRITTPRTME